MSERIHPDRHSPGGFVVHVGGADQSWVDPDDPERLEFDYVQRIADIVDDWRPPPTRLRIVHIGGAGMTLPRYFAHTRPTSAQIVCEPDEALTEEVRRVIPLPRNSGIKVRPVDGRAGLSQLRESSLDLVIVDAFVDSRVPAELVTVECFAAIHHVLDAGGLVTLNLTDQGPQIYTRRVLAGLSRYFSQLVMGTEPAVMKGRRFGNVVVSASNSQLPLDAILHQAASAAFPYRMVYGSALRALHDHAQPFWDGDSEPSPAPRPDWFASR